MKLYCFYIIKEEPIDHMDYPGVGMDSITKSDYYYHALYAYTTDNHIREEFKSLRDMNLFYEKIIEFDSKKDFYSFEDKYLPTDKKLDYREFTTKGIHDNTIKKSNVEILCTEFEYIVIRYSKQDLFFDIINYIFDEFVLKEKSEYHIFNDELISVLTKDYMLNYNLALVYPIDCGDISDIELDELNLFIREFSNTFKKNK